MQPAYSSVSIISYNVVMFLLVVYFEKIQPFFIVLGSLCYVPSCTYDIPHSHR